MNPLTSVYVLLLVVALGCAVASLLTPPKCPPAVAILFVVIALLIRVLPS